MGGIIIFNDLVKFNKQRNGKEAVGFYLAYLLVGVLLAGLAGGMIVIISPNSSAYNFGQIVGTIYCIAIYFKIYLDKELKSVGYIMLGLVSGIISVLLGTFIGLIFPAFLTTREKNINS